MVYTRKRRVMDIVKGILLSRWFTATAVAFALMITIFSATLAGGKDVFECVFLAFLGWVFGWGAYMALTD